MLSCIDDCTVLRANCAVDSFVVLTVGIESKCLSVDKLLYSYALNLMGKLLFQTLRLQNQTNIRIT
jgi:hypothetical protein